MLSAGSERKANIFHLCLFGDEAEESLFFMLERGAGGDWRDKFADDMLSRREDLIFQILSVVS